MGVADVSSDRLVDLPYRPITTRVSRMPPNGACHTIQAARGRWAGELRVNAALVRA
jgi:hypothetical protein